MRGTTGMGLHAVSRAYIITFAVVFRLPYAMPVCAQSMNYSLLITGGSVYTWRHYGSRNEKREIRRT